MLLRIEPALGDGDMVRRLDEPCELGIRHLVTVDPEAPDRHFVRGALFRALVVVAHREAAALDPDHAGVWAVTFGQAGIVLA